MENASKALIMAASVLLGVMIISFAVYLFSTFGSYSNEVYLEMEARRMDAFNSQFTKYYGTEQRENPYKNSDNINSDKYYDGPILCTVQDVVTIAKLARDSNSKYGVYEDDPNYVSTNENEMYVTVNLINEAKKGKNIENWTENEFTNLIQNNTFIEGSNNQKAKYYYIKSISFMNVTDTLQRVREVNVDVIDVEKYLKKIEK